MLLQIGQGRDAFWGLSTTCLLMDPNNMVYGPSQNLAISSISTIEAFPVFSRIWVDYTCGLVPGNEAGLFVSLFTGGSSTCDMINELVLTPLPAAREG